LPNPKNKKFTTFSSHFLAIIESHEKKIPTFSFLLLAIVDAPPNSLVGSTANLNVKTTKG